MTSTLKDFHEQCLKAHNSYHLKHQVEPLVLDESLNRLAQNWAENVARRGVMQHRPNNKCGENIYFYGSSDPSFRVQGKDAVVAWYNEIRRPGYVFGRSNNPGTGHFTQVVWKGSKRLGVGVSKNSRNQTFVVCNYDPPGNYVGQYSKNVLKASAS